jgi:hypothetical protein
MRGVQLGQNGSGHSGCFRGRLSGDWVFLFTKNRVGRIGRIGKHGGVRRTGDVPPDGNVRKRVSIVESADDGDNYGSIVE